MRLGYVRAAAEAAFAALTLLACSPALAAGGAHVVDDAGVETPGHCHLENWLSRSVGGEGALLNLGPACTPAGLPTLELGAAIQRIGGVDGTHWLAGPTVKWAMRPGGGEGEGAGIGLAFALLAEQGAGRVDSAAFTVPVTVALGPHVTANLNLGLIGQRGRGAHAFQGVQLVYAPSDDISLMVEVYSTGAGAPDAQAGLRWTVDGGRIDFDLLVARTASEGDRPTVTLGFTVRR